jgi:transcriptional regulator with XRE-family HTH domain
MIMETDVESFWVRVNYLIKSKKTKQEILVSSCGISIQTLRGWITKKRYPGTPESYRIAQALGVSVEYLVTGEAPGKPDTSGLISHAEALLDGLKKL